MRFVVVGACSVISRRLGVLLGITLFGVMLVSPALAQQVGDLNAMLKRSNELRAAGNYPAALVEAQKAEAGAKARFGVNHLNYAIALGTLALVYQEQGKYGEAEGSSARW